MQGEAIYTFGPFAVDAEQRVLLRGDEPLRLTPREIDVLIALLERHGEIVDKRRLLDQVWRGVCVEECNLSQHVATLRRVLGDDAREPQYIETVPRRGYRFVAPVSRTARGAAAAAATATAIGAGAASSTSGEGASGTSPEVDPRQVARRGAGGLRRGLARSAPALLAIGAGLGCWGLLRGPARPATIRSVAVAPFANLTGDAHHDHVAETLTTALLGDLRSRRDLRVEAGSERSEHHAHAGVDGIVEAALLTAEGRLRIAAELIDARTGRLVWADVFEGDPVALLETEEKIVRGIASRLERPLEGDDAQSRARASRREYALARQYLGGRTPHVVEEALSHFQAAVQLDPGSALAHAGLANAYLLGAEQRVLDPQHALSSAEQATRRALELEPGLAEAHAAFGQIAAARWDFEGAEQAFRRAIAIDPAVASAHERYAALLTVEDRHDEAIPQARIARDLDPSSPGTGTTLAASLFYADQHDAAIEQALAVLRRTPRFPAAYDILGWAHRAKGHHAEAIAAFTEAVRLSGRSPAYVAALANALAAAGSADEAKRLVAELQRLAPPRTASPLDLAEVFAALGQPAEALRHVELAATQGAPWLQRIDAGGGVAALHDQDRFQELRSRLRRAVAPVSLREEVPAAARGL